MLLHLLKRDLRHTRWYLVAMLAVLGALCAFPSVVYGRLGGPVENSNAMNTYVLILAAYVVANLALVWRLVAEDAPLSETAFWRTRPLAPGVVLGAKLIYAALFIVVVPALVTLPAGVGLDLGLWTSGAATVAQMQGFLALFGLAVAMLSRRMLVGLAVVFGVYVLLAAGGSSVLSGATRGLTEVELYFGHALMVTRNALAVGVVVVSVAWAVWRAYKYRQQRRGLAVVVVGLVAAVLALFWWPWALLPSALTAPGPMVAEVRADAAKELRCELSEAGTNTVKGSVWGTLSRVATDEALWRVERIEVESVGADGRRRTVYPSLHSATGMLGGGPAAWTAPSKQGFGRVGSAKPTFPVWLPGLLYAKPEKVAVRLVLQNGLLRNLEVPARAGAGAGEQGDRLRVVDVAVNSEYCGLTIVDQRAARSPAGFNDSWRNPAWRYLLVHEKTGAVAVTNGASSTRMFDGFYVATAVTRVQFDRSEFDGMSESEVREWIAGARLVRVTYKPTEVFAVELGPMALPGAR